MNVKLQRELVPAPTLSPAVTMLNVRKNVSNQRKMCLITSWLCVDIISTNELIVYRHTRILSLNNHIFQNWQDATRSDRRKYRVFMYVLVHTDLTCPILHVLSPHWSMSIRKLCPRKPWWLVAFIVTGEICAGHDTMWCLAWKSKLVVEE